MKDFSKIRSLYFFDFDATLIDSPIPEIGKIIWEEKTGNPYPHIGWWGKPESLDTTVFNIKPFLLFESMLKVAFDDSESYVIILTSRIEKLRDCVQNVLDVNNIRVDKLDLKRNNLTKGQRVLRYLDLFPNVEIVNAFDDKDSDILSYIETKPLISKHIVFNIFFAENGKLKSFKNPENGVELSMNTIMIDFLRDRCIDGHQYTI